ncbi:hypothetical protein BHE74_00055796 [Ensete ventricosum]|nr:hypothetical protein BHE74_00055796 [Ensete ventricosum]
MRVTSLLQYLTRCQSPAVRGVTGWSDPRIRSVMPPAIHCLEHCRLVGPSHPLCHAASLPLSGALQDGRPIAFALPCCQSPAVRGPAGGSTCFICSVMRLATLPWRLRSFINEETLRCHGFERPAQEAYGTEREEHSGCRGLEFSTGSGRNLGGDYGKETTGSPAPDQAAAGQPRKRVKITMRKHKSHHSEGSSRATAQEKEPEAPVEEDSSPSYCRPRSMKDLCGTRVRKDDDGYYVLQVAD